MSWNVNYGNPDIAGAVATIAQTDTDVVLLQEVTDHWKRPLGALKKQYPHQSFYTRGWRAGGLAVLSKQPIAADEVWSPPQGGYFPAGRLLLDTPLGRIQVLHVHLRPNIDNGNWIVGYQTTPPIRRREIETYWKKLDRTVPTLVAGDFNELPTGLAVQFLADRGLTRVVTPRAPTTWRHTGIVGGKEVELLSMDIDHVVVDATFTPTAAEVLDTGKSDHRPVVVSLQRSKP